MQKASYLEYLDRRSDPSDGLRPQLLNFDELLGRDVSLFRYENRSRIRHLLQAVGKMHICSSSIISLIYSMFYCLNDHFACVNPHPDLQGRIIQSGYPVLHC